MPCRDEESVAVSLFRLPSNYAEGHTRERQGRVALPQSEGLTRLNDTKHS